MYYIMYYIAHGSFTLGNHRLKCDINSRSISIIDDRHVDRRKRHTCASSARSADTVIIEEISANNISNLPG